mgnify:CR=1 FL=1
MWKEHGPDYVQKRGVWTLKVRRFKDGWNAVILHGDYIIWRDTQHRERLDVAQSCCQVAAASLAAELLGGEE